VAGHDDNGTGLLLTRQGRPIDRHTVTRGDLAMPAAISDETR